MTPQHSDLRIGDVVTAAIGWNEARRALERSSKWHAKHADELVDEQHVELDAALELLARRYMLACDQLEAAVDALDVVFSVSLEPPAGGDAVPPAGENGRRSS